MSLIKSKYPVNPRALGNAVFSRASKGLTSTDMDFPTFLRKAWPILEPANPLVESWYIDYICEYLMLVTRGIIRRLLINIPPRNLKSSIVTILWPVWSWTIKPWMKWIFCSYSSSLSVKHSLDRRRIIESDWFKNNWGTTFYLADDQNQKNEYENSRRGQMISTSVGGTSTGKGGDVIVEDDMLNPYEADSEAMREHSINMHKNVLTSRLDNPRTGAKVVVEQRTHAKDLTGHILKNEEGWTPLILPLRAEKKTIITFPISKKQVIREVGDFLNPERQGEREYGSLKKDMGTRTLMAQCQQNPTSDEGNILKRHWWKFWKEPPAGCDVAIQSWDMSFKKTDAGSFVVGQVWKKRGADYFLMDQFRDRIDFSDTITAVLGLSGKHIDANAKLVEDAANGPAVISTLQSKVPGIIAVPPHGSKIARAQAVAPFAEAGNIHLPHPDIAPWIYDFIEECAAFKGAPGEINDQVDGMTQAIIWLQRLDFLIAEREDEVGSFVDNEENYAVGGFNS